MQISDLIGQYHSVSQGEPMTNVKGVQNLVSTLQDLAVGSIFEGTVNSIKNGQVVLGLSNGHVLNARLDASIQLQQGQSMFFQVKSNQESQIAIKPFMVDGNSGNLTIMDALKAANLPVDGKYLSMVSTMMEEQMPIDRNSLTQMARTVVSNPDVSVQTVVQMKKFDLPVTREMASQFENYKDDANAVHKEMETFLKELPNAMSGTKLDVSVMKQTASQILDVITENSSDSSMVENQAVDVKQEALEPAKTQLQFPVSDVLSEKEMQQFDQNIKGLFGEEMKGLEYKISAKDSVSNILKDVTEFLKADWPVSKEGVSKFLASPEVGKLLESAMKEQWLIKPEELKNNEQIKALYERLEKQLDSMEKIVKASGQDHSPVLQMATQIKDNVEFMNQVNQMYQYVQIPLQMSGQSASGELFVYRNHKGPKGEDEEVSAFLHLDMEHLGSTDVSVKLKNKEVSTNFYLDNDESYDFLQKYLPLLDERLQKKGYITTITAINDSKKVRFVDDFLKQDQPVTAQVKRFSFDMRA